MLHIVLVEDEHLFAKSVSSRLKRDGFDVTICTDLAQAHSHFAENTIADALLLDVRLPDGSGLDFLSTLRKSGNTIPVIVITAYGELDDAVLAMKLGANDYLKKPLDLDELGLMLAKVLETGRIKKKLDYSNVRDKQAGTSEQMFGSSEAILSLKKQLNKIASLVDIASENQPVILIRGETGTGKDVAARYYHQVGNWRDKPFVHVDCASLPRELIEAELFGYERGAFTNAIQAKPGLIEVAEDGMLFLDEIGDLPIDLQAKLLNVLERRVVRRVGATKEIAVKAQFIAATNRDLNKMVEQGEFRSDLLFRLNLLEINLPPLRQRLKDIIPLTEYFVKQSARRYGLKSPILSTEALKALSDYSWPGNIRELKHVIERAVMLSNDGLIEINDLMLQASIVDDKHNDDSIINFEAMTLDQVEKYLIEKALERTARNVSQAARQLGLTRMAMRYRMDKHAL